MKIEFKIEDEQPVIEDIIKLVLVDDFVEPTYHNDHHKHHHEVDAGSDACSAFMTIIGQSMLNFFWHLLD